jgi:uncharacterized membrane protein
MTVDRQGLTPELSAVGENVQAIKRWESAILHGRLKAEQVSDWIACTAGSGPVLVLHVLWFGAWVTVNSGVAGGIRPFDPFPFPFLTMTVSLERIATKARLSVCILPVCARHGTAPVVRTCAPHVARSSRR